HLGGRHLEPGICWGIGAYQDGVRRGDWDQRARWAEGQEHVERQQQRQRQTQPQPRETPLTSQSFITHQLPPRIDSPPHSLSPTNRNHVSQLEVRLAFTRWTAVLTFFIPWLVHPEHVPLMDLC